MQVGQFSEVHLQLTKIVCPNGLLVKWNHQVITDLSQLLHRTGRWTVHNARAIKVLFGVCMHACMYVILYACVCVCVCACIGWAL